MCSKSRAALSSAQIIVYLCNVRIYYLIGERGILLSGYVGFLMTELHVKPIVFMADGHVKTIGRPSDADIDTVRSVNVSVANWSAALRLGSSGISLHGFCFAKKLWRPNSQATS